MLLFFLFSLMIAVEQAPSPPTTKELVGAWQMTKPDGTQGLWIMDENYFSITYYKTNSPEFISTAGGKWSLSKDGSLEVHWEYNTKETDLVGQQQILPLVQKGKSMTVEKSSWEKVDNGTPGELKGAWLITGRQIDGEMQTMTPGARKTMKILSGTRFQWIAYNSETGEFSGTGGGSYTSKDGKYTETIEFFSRDNSRVGASLTFNYKLQDGKWHHSGFSSKGDPLYEIWSTRQSLGI